MSRKHLLSQKTPTARQKYLRVQTKQHIISKHLRDSFDLVVKIPKARIIYTYDFFYSNKYRAVLHGLPPDLIAMPPSEYHGGESRLDYVIRRINQGTIFYTVFSEEKFALRRQHAIENDCYEPTPPELKRKERSDKGGIHARAQRKKLLWGKVPPLSKEMIDDDTDAEADEEAAAERLPCRSSLKTNANAKKRMVERNLMAKYVDREKESRRPRRRRRSL